MRLSCEILLDANVVSERPKPDPDAGVVAWLAESDKDRASASVNVVADLHPGIERLPAGARRDRLDTGLTEPASQRFEDRLSQRDIRPGTKRTFRGAALQTAAAEMTQHAIAARKAGP